MSHHSGTTICHFAKIWYTSHNMYLIYRVNIYAAEHIQQHNQYAADYISIAETHLYIHNCFITKETYMSLSEYMKAYYVAVNIFKNFSHPTLEASTYRPMYNIILLLLYSVAQAYMHASTPV
jgi:hypothetical protein